MKKKNKKCFNIFCYSKDYPCLKECIKSIRRLRGCKTAMIFLFDDFNSPMTEEEKNSLLTDRYIHYEQTKFERNKNLNGIDCVIGILICMELSRRLSHADIVFKVDCDSYINRLDYFVDGIRAGYSMVGTHVNNENYFQTPPYCAGCIYALDGKVIHELILNNSILSSPPTPQSFPAHFPEDLTITQMVRIITNNNVLIKPSNYSISSSQWILAPMKFEENLENFNILNRYRFYDIVNFGNRFTIHDNNPHKVAGKAMGIYGDFVESLKF